MKILFILWAGVSAPSWIPTFQGSTKWNFNQSFFNIDYLKKHKSDATKFFKDLRINFSKKKPNFYHEYIMKLDKSKYHEVSVISQNIDNLDLWIRDIIKIHWNLMNNRCLNNPKHNNDKTDIDIWDKCKKCNSLIIPDIVFYWDNYKDDVIKEVKNKLKEQYDYCIVIWTELNIQYTHSIFSKIKSYKYININPEFIIDDKKVINYKTLDEFNKDIWNNILI